MQTSTGELAVRVAGLLEQAIFVHRAVAVGQPGEEEDALQLEQGQTAHDALRLGWKDRNAVLRVHRLHSDALPVSNCGFQMMIKSSFETKDAQ